MEWHKSQHSGRTCIPSQYLQAIAESGSLPFAAKRPAHAVPASCLRDVHHKLLAAWAVTVWLHELQHILGQLAEVGERGGKG